MCSRDTLIFIKKLKAWRLRQSFDNISYLLLLPNFLGYPKSNKGKLEISLNVNILYEAYSECKDMYLSMSLSVFLYTCNLPCKKISYPKVTTFIFRVAEWQKLAGTAEE